MNPTTLRYRRIIRLYGVGTIALLLLVVTGATGCKRESPTAARLPLAPASNAREPKRQIVRTRWNPPYELRLQMSKLQLFSEEIRRRIVAKVNISGAAKVVAKQAAQLETRGAPSNALELISTLRIRSKALTAPGVDPKNAFNAMLDTCIGCHRQLAPSSLTTIKALKIP